MLTAGDEFGRTQKGNNNAYAQDNETTWLNWEARDQPLERYAALLAAMRRAVPSLRETRFLTGQPSERSEVPDVAWLSETGMPLDEAGWNDPERHRFVMVLGGERPQDGRLAVIFNGDRRACVFTLPSREGFFWVPTETNDTTDISRPVPGRTVIFMIEREAGQARTQENL
jgi:glycogen operon protein